MSNILIALGGNIGDVRNSFDSACEMLGNTCNITAKSKLYTTPALVDDGAKAQPDYLNAVIHVVSTLTPSDLLAELHRIEAANGRERKEHWGSRTLDLDLLDYEGFTSTNPALMLPHPELHQRLFVLLPLSDVIPNWVHPTRNQSVSQMIETLKQQGETWFEGEIW